MTPSVRTIEERNRLNAQHSTGPKSAEGKARSAQNRRTHGLSASTLWIPAEAQAEFQSLLDSLHREIRPIGELQAQFFDQLVHASWQQQIARNLLAQAQHAGDGHKIATAHRYLAQYERSFARALREIKALQADLALRAAEPNEPIALLPESYDTRRITREIGHLVRFHPPAERPAVRHSLLAQIGHVIRRVLTPASV